MQIFINVLLEFVKFILAPVFNFVFIGVLENSSWCFQLG